MEIDHFKNKIMQLPLWNRIELATNWRWERGIAATNKPNTPVSIILCDQEIISEFLQQSYVIMRLKFKGFSRYEKLYHFFWESLVLWSFPLSVSVNLGAWLSLNQGLHFYRFICTGRGRPKLPSFKESQV